MHEDPKDLINRLRTCVFEKSGQCMDADDPMFLQAIIMQEMYSMQVSHSNALIDKIIGNNLGEMDKSIQVHAQKLEAMQKSHQENSESFLAAYEDILHNKHQEEEILAHKLSREIETKLTVPLVILIILCLINMGFSVYTIFH